MNKDLIQKFLNRACWDEQAQYELEDWLNVERFAELIVAECDRLNRAQAHELAGVVADTACGGSFDGVCLDTVKRVESYLGNGTLKKHFGIEL